MLRTSRIADGQPDQNRQQADAVQDGTGIIKFFADRFEADFPQAEIAKNRTGNPMGHSAEISNASRKTRSSRR